MLFFYKLNWIHKCTLLKYYLSIFNVFLWFRASVWSCSVPNCDSKMCMLYKYLLFNILHASFVIQPSKGVCPAKFSLFCTEHYEKVVAKKGKENISSIVLQVKGTHFNEVKGGGDETECWLKGQLKPLIHLHMRMICRLQHITNKYHRTQETFCNKPLNITSVLKQTLTSD